MTDGEVTNNPWVVDTTAESFEQDVVQQSTERLVVVDFWAPWCQPCTLLTPILQSLAAEYDGKFALCKINTEEQPEVAAQFGVQSIPLVVAVRDGQVASSFNGLLPEEQIREWLDDLQPTPAQVLIHEASLLLVSDPEAAQTKLEEAIQLDGENSDAKIALARLHVNQGRIEPAQQLIQSLEDRGFLEPEAERIKSEIEVRIMGDQVGDADACRAEAEADPENLNLQFKLAESLAGSGQHEEALQIGLQLIQQDRAKFREPCRDLMVDIFRILPDDSPLTSEYRRKLSAAMY